MTPVKQAEHTPAMRQYLNFKKQHPGCVLFFRMGDFYEMFFEDAQLAHKVLGVTLTQRSEGIPMAGVPFHAVEGYLRRMIQAGYRVAVCDQVEDAAKAKGIVKRDVTRVITPGTLTDESLLNEDRENPLVAVADHGDGRFSVAWVELSTGSFLVMTLASDQVADEMARIGPRELLYAQTTDDTSPPFIKTLAESISCALTARPAWQFRQSEAMDELQRQYQVAQLCGFGFDPDDPALSAAGAIVAYLRETQRACGPDGSTTLAHLQPPKRFARTNHLIIDQVTLRSLEVERTTRNGETEGSLLGIVQDCVSAMGKRLLRHWLCYPLCERIPIEQRQEAVQTLYQDSGLQDRLRAILDQIHDVPRITARLAMNRATPRDLVGLGRSIEPIRSLQQLLENRPSIEPFIKQLHHLTDSLERLGRQISKACVDAPPAHLRDGGIIQNGYDTKLDELRGLQRDSHEWLAGYQKQLITQTNIPSLKVGYNKVFGYYIELTATNRDKAPDDWTRKQTLKNAERFITPLLKQFEHKVLSAQNHAIIREQELFTSLCADAQQQLNPLHQFAQVVAELDVLACFARRAARHRYVRPTMIDEPVLQIHGGRHPVLDQLLGERFVPNDVELGARAPSPESPKTTSIPDPRTTPATLALITGPNMAGKSTYIRQTAVITLLAHSGSFVPADQATIGLCDRIFTRVGASDELHSGRSTFMVEMTEAANICHHATPRSLVILDEIGRGTSTLDGLSLAWAMTEFLANQTPRTLFATHYHELTALAGQFPNIINLNVTVREWQDQIVFLHRIAQGGTNRSYGIHVAKIAGMPTSIVQRAQVLLSDLEVAQRSGAGITPPKELGQTPQLSLFTTEYLNHPVVDQLKQTNLSELSPLEAFDLLRQLTEQLDDDAAGTTDA